MMGNGKPDNIVLIGVILCIAGIIILADSMLVRGLGVAVLVGGVFLLWRMRRQFALDLDKQRNNQMITILDALQERRHEWLNGLQVVYGYIRLEKYDRLLGAVHNLEHKLDCESRASKLDIPELAWFFHIAVSKYRMFDVEVDQTESFNSDRLQGDRRKEFSHAVIATVRAIDRHAHHTDGELPLLTVNFFGEEDRLCCHLHFEGKAEASALAKRCRAIRHRLERAVAGSRLTHDVGAEQTQIHIIMPYD